MASRLPISELNNEDFPTLARPTMAMIGADWLTTEVLYIDSIKNALRQKRVFDLLSLFYTPVGGVGAPPSAGGSAGGTSPPAGAAPGSAGGAAGAVSAPP